YVHRMVREIGALGAVLGGIDLLVFTAGIGEHNAVIRERVCAALGLFGIRLDSAANAEHAPVISAADSATVVAVEPTNEEWLAALRANQMTLS
ncbi:MAG: acetate kinase, partial [Dokdonella sp.]